MTAKQLLNSAFVVRVPQSRLVLPAAGELARELIARVLPPLIMLAFFILVWHLATLGPKSALPGPLQVVRSSWELIGNPF